MSVDFLSNRLTHRDHVPCFGRRRLMVEWRMLCLHRPWEVGRHARVSDERQGKSKLMHLAMGIPSFHFDEKWIGFREGEGGIKEGSAFQLQWCRMAIVTDGTPGERSGRAEGSKRREKRRWTCLQHVKSGECLQSILVNGSPDVMPGLPQTWGIRMSGQEVSPPQIAPPVILIRFSYCRLVDNCLHSPWNKIYLPSHGLKSPAVLASTYLKASSWLCFTHSSETPQALFLCLELPQSSSSS